MQRRRELYRLAMPCDVHVHRAGLGAQEVIVEGRDLDPALEELLHHRVDLVLGEDEVAHDHGLVAASA